jgi:hypothetical protein
MLLWLKVKIYVKTLCCAALQQFCFITANGFNACKNRFFCGCINPFITYFFMITG